MSTPTVQLELTQAEVSELLRALETREKFLRDWGQAEGHWSTPEERAMVLRPLDALAEKLMSL